MNIVYTSFCFHVTSESRVGSLRCKECAKHFTVPALLAQHLKIFHGDISTNPPKDSASKICHDRKRNAASRTEKKKKKAEEVDLGSDTNGKKTYSSVKYMSQTHSYR